MTFQGTPPGAATGTISRRTQALRPDIGLADEVVEAIRRERKRGKEASAIAELLTLPEAVVERALLAMRTPRPERTRRTLNVTREAGAFLHAERRPDEPVWKAFDRLVDELLERRRA